MGTDPRRRLVLMNLDDTLRNEDVRALFECYGRVVQFNRPQVAQFHRPPVRGPFAFATFEDARFVSTISLSWKWNVHFSLLIRFSEIITVARQPLWKKWKIRGCVYITQKTKNRQWVPQILNRYWLQWSATGTHFSWPRHPDYTDYIFLFVSIPNFRWFASQTQGLGCWRKYGCRRANWTQWSNEPNSGCRHCV